METALHERNAHPIVDPNKPHFIKCGPVPVIRNWRALPVGQLTRGERVCKFIETHLVTPEGEKIGQPIRLEMEQVMFFLAVYDNPAITDTAIKSVARKNAKTAEAAMIVLAHTVGPEAVQNSRLISGANSKDQAAEVYNYASKMALGSSKIRSYIRLVPSKKIIIGLPMNVEYQATSADAKTAHGKSPIVAIIDECGQIKGESSDYVDAIVTAQGAWENPLMIFISTQAATDADFLSIQIDDAIDYQPAKTVCHVFTTPEDADLLDEEGWKLSNPAVGKYRSEKDLRKLAQRAKRMPSFENTFRNLNLNQRISKDTPFVPKSIWQLNGQPPQSLKGKKVWGGLDLSSVSDLTGLVLVGEEGDVECRAWLPKENIIEKSRFDRVPWDRWAKQGFLTLTEGRAIKYEWVAKEIIKVFAEYDVQKINFDRYNMKFLQPWLEAEDMSEEQLEKFAGFGQGFVSMSPALRSLETALLGGDLKHGNNPILTMCFGNVKVDHGPAEGRKFTKRKSRGRIDLAVCLAMAEDARSGSQAGGDGWSIYMG